MGYGYTDYASMQQAAKRRVYEMQRRSRMAIEGNDHAEDGHQSAGYRKEEPDNAYERFYGCPRTECDDDVKKPENECRQQNDDLCRESADHKEPELCRIQSGDKLLIIAMLMIFLSEGRNIQMIAVLLYLLTGD